MKKLMAIPVVLLTASVSAQLITSQYTTRLTDSGDGPVMPVVADALEPGVTPLLRVTTPNAQAPRLINLVSPAIAIPYASKVRELEAYWNGVPLQLIDPEQKEITEEAHSYGSMIPFFKPLFSVAAVGAGPGTLELRAFDASHTQLASVAIPGLEVVKAPAPRSAAAIAATPHPRIYLTPARLTAIRSRDANDIARKRYEVALNRFLSALAGVPDVTSPQFESRIYDPESYIPLLALTVQLRRSDDPATATKCADAAHALVMRMATEYDNGTRSYGRDTGYDIRFGLRDLMLAFDWMPDRFTQNEKALIVRVATDWVDWYHTAPGYAETWPVENYYAGYVQGIALTAIATAGENPDADRILTLLRVKLGDEMPILNQRLAGGDWAEGWNYGPYTMVEFALLNALLRDAGEDWSAIFDFLQPLARSLTYQVSPEFSETRSFGGYSGDYPSRTSPALLAVLSTTTRDGALASRLYRSMDANPENDFADSGGFSFYEMIFGDAKATADVLAVPLSYFNSGTGRFFSKSSLADPDAYQVTTENTGYSYDHYGYANGDVRLYRGPACLVCPSAYRGEAFDGEGETTAFSTYLVNGEGQRLGLGRNNQNLYAIEAGSHAAIGMRFESSWASSRYDENIVDPANPLDYMIREVVHLRPGTLIVRDRHRRRDAGDSLEARWHLGSSDAVAMLGGGRYRIGSLFVSTAWPTGVVASFAADGDRYGTRVGTLMRAGFSPGTAPLDLVTVFSESLTIGSYAGGVGTLADGRRVTFTNSGVTVAPGGRRRPARR